MSHSSPKLHNAMWPGLVGKGDGEGQEPPISLEKMLQLTASAHVNGQKFDGIDYFLFFPHTNPEANDAELNKIADQIASYGFSVGSLVAPVWPGTVGDSAMGDDAAREKFISAVKMACRIAKIFNSHGVRKYGVIRIDCGPVRTVTGVTVYDDKGDPAAVSLADHLLDGEARPARLWLRDPTPPGRPLNGIEIDFIAGFGASGTDVPDTLKRAMLTHVAAMFAVRAAGSVAAESAAMPAGYDRLIAPYCRRRL